MADGSDDLTERAKRLIAERQYDEAIRTCRRALLTKPTSISTRLLLGEALLATQRYEQARVEMMALVRRNPNEAVAHRALGEAFLRAGQTQRALESLRKARDLDPGDTFTQDLIHEAAEDDAPPSHTIERWFGGDDEPATVETDLPPFEQEDTPPPGPLPRVESEPSVQIDPSLVAEAAAITHKLVPSPALSVPKPGAARQPPAARQPLVSRPLVPRPGGRKPTMVGGFTSPLASGSSPGAQAAPEPLPPPPPPPPRSRSVAPGSLPPPPPGRSSPGALPAASSSSPGAFAAGSRPSSLPPPPSAPPPPGYRSSAGETRAARPASFRAEPGTDELDLDELQSTETPLSTEDLDVPIPADDDATTSRVAADIDSMEEDVTNVADRASVVEAEAQMQRAALRAPPAAPPPSVAPPRPSSSAPAHPSLQAEAPTSVWPNAPVPASSGPAPSRPEAVEDLARTSARQLPSEPAPRPFLGNTTSDVGGAPEPPTAQRGTRAAPSPPISSTDAIPRTRPPMRVVAAVGVGLLIGMVLLFFGVSSYLRRSADAEIEAAAIDAGEDGRRATLERAIVTLEEHGIDDGPRAALHARLLALALLEHGEDRGAAADADLASLEAEDRGLPDARIARSVLYIARANPAQALEELSGLATSGDRLAEAFRARALAAWATGRVAEAEESARQALSVRPATPRHAALEAVLRERAGDAAGALSVLDAVPTGPTSPAVRVARARVLLDSGGDPDRAAAEADAVIADLAPAATARELGWAHLVRARIAASRGDAEAALRSAREAASRQPPHDESYGIATASALVAGGQPDEAGAVLERLPLVSADPAGRAMLIAEVALAAGRHADAATALTSAGPSPHAEFMRGRVAEAQGRLDEARVYYERAAADPREALAARTRAGAVLLGLGRAADARTQLEDALRLAPADPEAVPLFVRAALGTDDAASAERALSAALALRPSDVSLLSARGAVLLALGRPAEAIPVLEQAISARAEDPELRADLGEAALRAGRMDVAGSAFAEAARLAPTLARAQLGVARVAIEGGNFDEADAALGRAETASAPALELGRARAQLAVARGLGAGAIESVQEALQATRRDPALLIALGRLQAQAEQDRSAERTFGLALRSDRDNPEALIGRAFAEIRRGRLRDAARSIDAAERALGESGSQRIQARVQVARGWLAFEGGRFDDANRLAEAAIALDARCGDAHLLMASVASERGGNPVPHFRSALEAHAVPPEAVGRLAIRLGANEEGCALARRYVAAAPEGWDRDDVDGVIRRCD